MAKRTLTLKKQLNTENFSLYACSLPMPTPPVHVWHSAPGSTQASSISVASAPPLHSLSQKPACDIGKRNILTTK